MTKFSYTDDDDAPHEPGKTNAFRNWLTTSLDLFRFKKFNEKHSKEVERRREEDQLAAQAKSDAVKAFQERKQQHYASFRGRPKAPVVPIPSTSGSTTDTLSKSWLEEYNHPSSTANVSIHETMGESAPAQISKVKLDTSNLESSFDLSSTFNSTMKSIFSNSVLTGNAPTGPAGSTFKLPTDKLDGYTGARPSFGVTAVTSTPVGKIFAAPSPPPPPKPSSTGPFSNVIQPPKAPFIPTPSPLSKPEAKPVKLNTIVETNDVTPEPAPPVRGSPAPKPAFQQEKPKETPMLARPMPSSSLIMYYSHAMDRKEDNDIAKDRFQKTGDNALRGAIKRTINDKLATYSKKHATQPELRAAISFMAALVGGKTVEGYGGQKLQVLEDGAVAYTYDTIITYCLGVMERDNELVHVLAHILRGVCQQNSAFESVLLGLLFSNSSLLSLDQQICTDLAEKIAANRVDRTTMYGKEQSTIKLFLALHLNSKGESSERSTLNMGNLWRNIAVVLNSRPCIFSTIFIVTTLLEICSSKLRVAYPQQWPKITNLIQDQLVPLLEKNLQTSALAQTADEGRFISVLRNVLENL